MKYELEFIGFNEPAKDADAICFRFYNDSLKRYIIGVYDGGTQKYGEYLKKHMLKYYFQDPENLTIDFVICSHSDLDHASGLTEILNNFTVMNLVMNRPWKYIDDLFPRVDDGRITKKSLEERLRKAYPYIDKLEKLAIEKGIPIFDGFQGTKIYSQIEILSPSKEFYLDLLVESEKTPLTELVTKSFLERAITAIKNVIESWTNELLREDVSTTAENETSIILIGDMIDEKFLLTGDSGVRGLKKAILYAKDNVCDLTTVKVYQIPHHGGRHNVSPSVLNSLVGKKLSEADPPTKTAIVSISKDSDHPRKMVTNAFIRRGAKVFEARTSVIRHQNGTPDREGWVSANNIGFSKEVEDWEA